MTETIIAPKTKVAELLDAYPQLEPVLIGYVPAFEKLKSPVLRKTVARITTLQQAAAIGGVNVENLINRLRETSYSLSSPQNRYEGQNRRQEAAR